MKKYMLEVSVFLGGAVVMLLELVGSRILAPYVGNNLYSWTSLLGVTLGSLGFGYWFGGKLSDLYPSRKLYASLFLISGVLIALIGFSKESILTFLSAIGDIRLGSFLGSVFLFFLPSIFLGMISPFAARLKMHDIQHSGSVIGSLYALSTFGSIVGTFTGGFFLIAYLGSTKIIFLLSVAQFIMGVLLMPNLKTNKVFIVFTSLLTLILSFGVFTKGLTFSRNFLLADIDTEYNRFWIFDAKYDGRLVRYLATDSTSTQSAIFLENLSEPVYKYLEMFNMVRFFPFSPKKTLLIGGGAYVYPKQFLNQFPGSQIDVVEIDGDLLEIAKQYFYFEEDPRIQVFNEDGRLFLNRNSSKYDLIFVDAYGAGNSVPYHLTTEEAVSKIYNSLNENGVVLINIISSIDGKNGKFLRAEYLT